MWSAGIFDFIASFWKGVGTMSLELNAVDCGYTRQLNVRAADLELLPGEFHCLLGLNGCGKTALLKTLAGLLPLRGGSYYIDGVDMAHATAHERSGCLAYVPQSHSPVFPFAVSDVVVMGRAGNWPRWAGPSERDWQLAQEALETIGLLHCAERPYSELSGGERQMVMIARALAQGSRYIVLDEPAASLDLANQARLLSLLERLAAQGKGILMTSHNPEHALRYASHVAIIREHRMRCLGAPASELTAERLREIYHIDFIVQHMEVPEHGRLPFCIPTYIRSDHTNA
jgi:iron complex transport system ATP-binding protein